MSECPLLQLPRELRDMIIDQVLLLRCDELEGNLSSERNGKDKNPAHDEALKIKGQNKGLMDGVVQSKDYSTRMFDTPLPPSNPVLNFALGSHQLKDEIVGRAKAMSFTFAAEFRKVIHEPLSAHEFTWTRPMPLAFPKQQQSPTEDVDITFRAGYMSGTSILEPVFKLLVNIISNGSARKVGWDEMFNDQLEKIAPPVHTIREARINITTNLFPHITADDQYRELSGISQQNAVHFIWYVFNLCLEIYSPLFDITSYVVSHVGRLVLSIDGKHYRDIDLAAELLAPKARLGPGPAQSGYSALLKAILRETRRRQGLDGPSIDVPQGSFTVHRLYFVGFGNRTTHTQAKIIRWARELGFVVDFD